MLPLGLIWLSIYRTIRDGGGLKYTYIICVTMEKIMEAKENEE